ncbi:MAG: hypothetical protein ABIH34_02595 [Nanoarchaeota archaeon]
MSLDEMVQKAEASEGSPLEREVEAGRASFFTPVTKYLGGTALIAGANAVLSGFNFLITTAGFMVGQLVEKGKAREKLTTSEFFKNMWKGMTLGSVGYYLYFVTESIARIYDLSKVTKALVFNPGMVMPFNLSFQAYSYAEETHGWKNMAKPWTWGNYAAGLYQDELKPHWMKNNWKAFKVFFPIHFVAQNYLPQIWQRISVGAMNDVIYRLIMPTKKEDKKESPYQNPYPSISRPAYAPGYA